MLRTIVLSCCLLLSVGSGMAVAADELVRYPLQDALELERVKSEIAGGVAFYWGDEAHPEVIKKHGTYKTSKRTNGFGKDRGDACAWAMASALVVLKERAEMEGGNAVINIVSNIKNIEESSTTEYSCLAGRMMVNVALKGTVVTVAQ